MSSLPATLAHLTVEDVGEFQAISFGIEKAISDVSVSGSRGNDASSVNLPQNHHAIVLSCDTAPKPAVWDLVSERWEAWGWLAVTAASSDLACTGSKPLSLMTSIECPRGTTLGELYSFNFGVARACKMLGFSHAGGNLREGARFACHTTVLGTNAQHGKVNNRSGAKENQLVAVLGSPGSFASAMFDAESFGFHELEAERQSLLLEPFPKLAAMEALVQEGLISASSDTSDGLLGAIHNICEASLVAIDLYIDEWELSEYIYHTSNRMCVEPWRMALMWGDWNVVVTIDEVDFERTEAICTEHGLGFVRLGVIGAPDPTVSVVSRTEKRRIHILRNEAFGSNTYDSGGDAKTYILKSDIFIDQ